MDLRQKNVKGLKKAPADEMPLEYEGMCAVSRGAYEHQQESYGGPFEGTDTALASHWQPNDQADRDEYGADLPTRVRRG